jgi:hypothetical protein
MAGKNTSIFRRKTRHNGLGNNALRILRQAVDSGAAAPPGVLVSWIRLPRAPAVGWDSVPTPLATPPPDLVGTESQPTFFGFRA